MTVTHRDVARKCKRCGRVRTGTEVAAWLTATRGLVRARLCRRCVDELTDLLLHELAAAGEVVR